MAASAKSAKAQSSVKRYQVQYPVSAYTFPRDAYIHQVWFDDESMHVALTDGRILAIPLWWIPTLHNALPEERLKFAISRDRTMLIWDPDQCAINDEIRLADYLGPAGRESAEKS